MNASSISKIVLLITIVILLGNAVAISRDYQDSWVLEGLEMPFALFVITYILAFFSEKKVAVAVALAVIARCVFLSIPNLKYVWFQGTAIDQQQQYAMANYVYNAGHVPTQGPIGVSYYGSTPLIQVSLALFSIVLNVTMVDSMKYLPVLLSSIYPLGTYVIMKNLKFFKDQSVMKYAVFISSMPISVGNYIITGAQFGVLFVFLTLTTLIMLLQKNDRRYWLGFILFIFGLAITHSVSSVLLAIFFLTAMVIQSFPLSQMMSSLRVPVVLSTISICGAWLLFSARYTFEAIVHSGLSSVVEGAPLSVPPRFFELARINALAAFSTILATIGAEFFLLLLASVGLIVLLTMWKYLEKASRSFLLVSAVFFLFVPIGALLPIPEGVFRITFFASPLFPIFGSILFFKYKGKRGTLLRRAVFSSIIVLITLFATLGFYGCQPLMPSASVLSKDLPTDEPIGYATAVNSIYQRQMIEFSQRKLIGPIAYDDATGNQISGLTDFNFSVPYLTSYYPLDKKQSVKEFYYFLIHLPGIAGPFENPVETRTKDMILEAVYSSSNIYANGQSFILLNQTVTAPP